MTYFIDLKRPARLDRPMPHARPARLGVLMLLLGATACSPYSFSSEVASMSSGVDKLSDAFTSGYDGLASDLATTRQIEMAVKRRKLLLAGVCDDDVAARPGSAAVCALYMTGNPEPRLTSLELTRAETMQAVQKLKKYANALAAVTNAADRTAYEAAVSQMSAAVGTLAGPANLAAPGVGVLAPAAINFLGWVFGTALDQQRYDTLRTSINRVGQPLPDKDNPNPQSPIRVVTRRLGEGLQVLAVARMDALSREADILVQGLNQRALSDEAYRKQLAEAWTAAATIEALRRSDPQGAAADLADAHDKLVLAVNDPGRNYGSLLKALGEFGEKVSTVQAAMKAASIPSTSSKKGS
jgi:hypothetical protein